MSTLFIVSTPIGNLEDLSPRGARVLREVALVIAEDTRVTRKLLHHIDSKAAVTSLHQHSNLASLRRVLSRLETGNAALVTDAGTPGISDPGAELVRAAAAAGHKIEAIPGPSAVTAALSVSGFPADRFVFGGFLSRRRTERRAQVQAAEQSDCPMVFYEAPHRIRAALRDFADLLGDRELTVCRELTKLHEEVFRGNAEAAWAHFEEPRGEFVIVVSGKQPTASEPVSDDAIGAALAEGSQQGRRGRDLVDWAVSVTGAPRRRVYSLANTASMSKKQRRTQPVDSNLDSEQVP